MYNIFSKKPEEAKRVFLRISIRLPAKLYLNGKMVKKVLVTEISSGGLSFITNKSETIPNLFELRFRLGLFKRQLKMQMEVKNRINSSEGMRLGCGFVNPSEEEKNKIGGYVSKHIDIYLPYQALSFAGFLFFIDSLWRILAYLIKLYYAETPFGKNADIQPSIDFYGVILILYFLFSIAAFFIIKSGNKIHFLIGLICFVPPLIFVLAKNILYFRLGLWENNFLIIIFFWLQVSFFIYAALSIFIGLVSVKKMKLVLGLMDLHKRFTEAKTPTSKP